MVKKNSEKITIFGSQGDLGSFLVKNLCSKYQVIAVSKKSKKIVKFTILLFQSLLKVKARYTQKIYLIKKNYLTQKL